MTKLKPFQVQGVRQIYRFGGRALLADEQGLGKTIQALSWITKLPSRRPVVIVTPATLKWTWQAEALTHFGLHTEVLEGKRPRGKAHLPAPIVIINYDILKSWLPSLLRSRPLIVVFDEIHYLKDVNSQRTKAAFRLVQYADSVLGLSGTPFTNHLIEIWPVLAMIAPDLFPSRIQFAWHYTKPKHRYGKWQFRGAKNKKELRQILLKTCMIRRLKKDYLKELPPKRFKVISCRLKSYVEYNEAEKDIIAWLAKTSPARANKARRSKALVRVGYLLRLAATLKLRFTKQWIKEFLETNPDRKLVCFTMNTAIIQELKKAYPKALVIDGSVKGRKRFETVRRFQSHKQARLLLGNWKAASVGLTLTAAQDAVALDLPWTPGDLSQGQDRLHRIGQKKQVTFYFLVAVKTIEEKLMKALKDKKKVLDSIMDGTSSVADFDILELLTKELYGEKEHRS